MIQLVDYCFGYADKKWLLNASFKRGSVIGIVGENGSGKSTFMKSLLGLLSQYGGKVNVADMAMEQLSIAVRSNFFNYFHTTSDYYQELYVHELISIGSKTVTAAFQNQLFQQMNITHLLNNKITEVSDGELQRIGLTRAIVNTKKVNLYDEPTVYLDYKNIAVLQQQIALNTANCVHFVSSHDFRFLAAIATDFLIFKKDREIKHLSGKATSDEIYRILLQ